MDRNILIKKRNFPCLSAVAVFLTKKLKMSNDQHILGQTIMCPIKQI